MAKSAKDVFAETMTLEMIEASDLRAKELLEEYDRVHKLRKALDLTREPWARSRFRSRSLSGTFLECPRASKRLSKLEMRWAALRPKSGIETV